MNGLSTKPVLVSLLSVLVENIAEHCKQLRRKSQQSLYSCLPLSVSLLCLSFLSTTSLEAKGLKDKCEMQLAITVPICARQCFWELGLGGTSSQSFSPGAAPPDPRFKEKKVSFNLKNAQMGVPLTHTGCQQARV